MKTLLLFILALFAAATGFAQQLITVNEFMHRTPTNGMKIIYEPTILKGPRNNSEVNMRKRLEILFELILNS
jgi:hypothetical protein